MQTTYILLNIEQTEMKLSNEKIEGFFQFAYFLVNVATTYHLLPLVCFLAFYLKLQTSVAIKNIENVLYYIYILHAIKV